MDETIAALRALNEPVPNPLRLPTEQEIEQVEKELGVKFHQDYTHYLLQASDVVIGTLEPATIPSDSGHTYIVYGPLANGAISLMFEGIPNYPDVSRFWNVVDKHNVSIFYTAPTAIRSLMGAGDDLVKQTSTRLVDAIQRRLAPEKCTQKYARLRTFPADRGRECQRADPSND